jgi:hypothetical protein
MANGRAAFHKGVLDFFAFKMIDAPLERGGG